MEAKIIDRGRGPQIAGSRITVYDVMDYYKMDWSANSIAFWLRLRTEQVACAIEYIEAHKDDVLREYQKMLDRDAKGNPPEILAKLEQSRQRVQAWLEEHRKAKLQENGHEGHPGGHQHSGASQRASLDPSERGVEGSVDSDERQDSDL